MDGELEPVKTKGLGASWSLPSAREGMLGLPVRCGAKGRGRWEAPADGGLRRRLRAGGSLHGHSEPWREGQVSQWRTADLGQGRRRDSG